MSGVRAAARGNSRRATASAAGRERSDRP